VAAARHAPEGRTVGRDDGPPTEPDLVVLSHLRWTWVWQRPQHLISRLAADRAASGARTWFVEEPHATSLVSRPVVRQEQHGDVTRVWLELPAPEDAAAGRRDFTAPGAERYPDLLVALLAAHGVLNGAAGAPHVWLYTPMALDLARALEPGLLVYDVMDDLASFANAPAGLRLRQLRALQDADVVLTGGRSLHAGVVGRRPDAHLFPSGVDTGHYAAARALREPHARPVAGYVGVLDERLDFDLLADLAASLPDWEIRMVGPVADFKIDRSRLPQAPNLVYVGQQRYEDLPAVMAEFDVALMPFALNEATRSISPTKTLEYLAAGLPVVSTAVPDVVADFADVVHIATPAGFARACREVVGHAQAERDRKVRAVEPRYEWAAIAARIGALLDQAVAGPRATQEEAST
jgi:glycosyltransferase involved in cell wall biosynthesis